MVDFSSLIRRGKEQAQKTKKIAVFGTYKTGFHNNEKLGKDAKFLGFGKIKGVMYLVGTTNRYPLLFIKTENKELKRDYITEIYEISSKNFEEIKEKEERESNKEITTFTDEGEAISVFVTDDESKTEPNKEEFIEDFIKKDFSAYLGSTFEIHALNKSIAEESAKEIVEKAIKTLEKDGQDVMTKFLKDMSIYIGDKKEIKDTIQTS